MLEYRPLTLNKITDNFVTKLTTPTNERARKPRTASRYNTQTITNESVDLEFSHKLVRINLGPNIKESNSVIFSLTKARETTPRKTRRNTIHPRDVLPVLKKN